MRQLFNKYISVILLFSCIHPVDFYTQTKHFNFEHITFKDGLPENSGSSIYQDHLGFIWFGTYAGLVKYDGYQLEHYRSDQKNVLKDAINSIREDTDGQLWLGTYSGLKKFNPVTKTFLSYDFPDSILKTYQLVDFLHISRDEKLWLIK